ncbi:adenylate isopentenyltransferase 5, chloroplastic-like [Neltuma alba]|uniref:adenylate isopentenyltransferase 5, chloroplastic-like n=1 Tax=Neltuma alba TaxID=207710 RepID=UPI0010A43B30|nr:adenylate isopentenyltransferase 5, chloroplastic-like [Prosopis alba]
MSIISVSVCKVQQASVNFERGLRMDPFFHRHRKEKVVVIMGATGSGKSKLAIDLATQFAPAEIINSDKMQVYQGLDITTNKVTEQECLGVPHHLLGVADPDLDFTAGDFIRHASSAVDSIVDRHCLPIIAGGSNSYIEALVNHHAEFQTRLEFCFLWVDVSLPVLHSFLSDRVDRMVEAGLVEEVRQMFDPYADYTKGVRKAIGVPELDQFLRAESSSTTDERRKKKLLEAAIGRLKMNNCRLASRQLLKIHRLHGLWKRNMHRLDATEAFMMRNKGEESTESWENQVVKKSRRIVHKFLYEESHIPPAVSSKPVMNVPPRPPPSSLVAMATATH